MTHSTTGLAAPRPRRLLAVSAIALAAATVACSTAPSAPPTAGPTGEPSAGPTAAPTGEPSAAPTTAGGIEHPTGARDVILRIEESGGFVPIEWSVTYTPTFTLYGDGTVIWRDSQAIPPESSDNLMRPIPLMIAKLDEAAVQALLDEAIGPGGLGIAVGPYNELGGADIPSTIFTINAGGLAEPKRVEVVGLSPDAHPQNAQVIAALAGLAEKLRTFDTLVAGGPYVPSGYRGILMPTEQAFGPVVAWPWADVSPDDFGGDNEFFLTRNLSAAEISAIGIERFDSGVSGFVLQDGDELFNFAIRPLLPDEIEAG